MKAEEYHKSLAPLKEACQLAGWACLTCPLTGGKPMIMLRHFALVCKVWRNRKRQILVREFSNIPLLFVFPLLWPLRKQIHFLINHNLQWAARDPLERFGLAMLARLDARWALFESRLEESGFQLSLYPQSVERFNISLERNLVLPHPVPRSPLLQGFPKGAVSRCEHRSVPVRVGSPVIGVAGYYRQEKGMDELICLLKEKFPEFVILLGVPNPEAAAHLDVEIVPTGSDEEYFKMISRCDVLVFNGGKNSYFYRASGPVADAAVCGTAVVAPDFPIIGKQVAGIGEVFQPLEKKPGAGSACFQPLEKMPDAIRTAVEKVRAGQYDFESYCAGRSAQALAALLEQFKNG